MWIDRQIIDIYADSYIIRKWNIKDREIEKKTNVDKYIDLNQQIEVNKVRCTRQINSKTISQSNRQKFR